jgi:hypothetical protein
VRRSDPLSFDFITCRTKAFAYFLFSVPHITYISFRMNGSRSYEFKVFCSYRPFFANVRHRKREKKETVPPRPNIILSLTVRPNLLLTCASQQEWTYSCGSYFLAVCMEITHPRLAKRALSVTLPTWTMETDPIWSPCGRPGVHLGPTRPATRAVSTGLDARHCRSGSASAYVRGEC